MLLQNPLELQEFNHPGALKQRCEQLPPPSSGSTSRKKKIPAPNPIFFLGSAAARPRSASARLSGGAAEVGAVLGGVCGLKAAKFGRKLQLLAAPSAACGRIFPAGKEELDAAGRG